MRPENHQYRSQQFIDFVNADLKFDGPFECILADKTKDPRTTVYYMPKSGFRSDPEFYLVTEEGVLTRFAFPGDLTGIFKLNGSAPKKSVELDPKYRFHLYRGNLPVNGTGNDSNSAGEQVLEQLVNYAYHQAEKVRDGNLEGMAGTFQALTYDSMVSRFMLLETLQSATDIIPDQTPRQIFVKAGDGCVMECNYCPEGIVPFKPYTKAQFKEHILNVKYKLMQIVGKDGIEKMNEGFINVSDIGWLDIAYKAGRTDLSSYEAARMMRFHLEWLEKLGTFFGSSTALALSKTPKGSNRQYSPEWLQGLKDAGINRLYLGVETAHTEGSRVLNKMISYDNKLQAALLVRESGIPLKAIIQLGVLGQGFHPFRKGTKEDIKPEYFVTWQEATDSTIRWLNQVQPYRILESVHQSSPNLPINKRIQSGHIVPYTNPRVQIEEERARLRKGLILGKRSGIEEGYEDYLTFNLLPNPENRQLIEHFPEKNWLQRFWNSTLKLICYRHSPF
jgi:hypothetical protein